MALPDVRTRIDQANLAAKEFSNLYHTALDKRRQAIGKVYCDDANMVWNGNAVNGREQISKFLETLPESEHTVESMDTQPVIVGEGMSDPKNASIMVTFTGKVSFQENNGKAFSQSVFLTVQDGKWKVVSDVYRFME